MKRKKELRRIEEECKDIRLEKDMSEEEFVNQFFSDVERRQYERTGKPIMKKHGHTTVTLF